MLIVLGFDSLDGDRIEIVDTPTLDSLAESGEMKTFDGLAPSELATTVLWGSMLAGESPKQLYPEYYDSESAFNPWLKGEWDKPPLNSLPAQVAEGFIIRRMTSLFPRKTQEHLRATVREKFGKRSFVETRLDRTRSLLDEADQPRLISVPGMNFDTSNKTLKGRLDISTGLNLGDATTAEQFERDAVRADADRLMRTLYAVRARENDLVVSHFFCLDLIQHLWATSQSKIQRWYGLYDHFLSQILDAISEKDTVVVVSDHGMDDNGIHSRRAFFGATKPIWGGDEYKMENLADVLSNELRSETHSVENASIKQSGVSEEVADHLKELGYFE